MFLVLKQITLGELCTLERQLGQLTRIRDYRKGWNLEGILELRFAVEQG